jgi:hypothetical protein
MFPPSALAGRGCVPASFSHYAKHFCYSEKAKSQGNAMSSTGVRAPQQLEIAFGSARRPAR